MSWISLDDIVSIVEYVIAHGDLSGPINAVSPQPVTNNEFTSALGKSLHRPTIFPVPALAMNLLLGEMANELLLSSARVLPRKLINSGYKFQNSDLGAFLRQLLQAA
jgi:NAD dependent epimerase/dehydratase family enzyme